MSVFFSNNNKLSLPERDHSNDGKYVQVEKGKPLAIELVHMNFGNITSMKPGFLGNVHEKPPFEVMVSTWVRTGESAKAAPRVINALRHGVRPFDNLSHYGAKQYGFPLMYYTDSYNGHVVRLSVEYLEIDKILKEQLAPFGDAMMAFAKITIFAQMLPYIPTAIAAAEVGRKLYNLINPNDLIALRNLDLAFKLPHTAQLTSGRYVLVGGTASSDFTEKYKLDANTNELVTVDDGRPAYKDDMKSAYAVIKIDARERTEYANFEIDQKTQELLSHSINKEPVEQLESLMRSVVSLAIEGDKLYKALAKAKEAEEATNPEKKNALKDIRDRIVASLPADKQSLLQTLFLRLR